MYRLYADQKCRQKYETLPCKVKLQTITTDATNTTLSTLYLLLVYGIPVTVYCPACLSFALTVIKTLGRSGVQLLEPTN